MGIFGEKLKEVSQSVLPIVVLIFLLHFFLAPLSFDVLLRCVVGTALIILGLTVFHVGVEIGVSPIGMHLGHAVTKYGKMIMVVMSGLVLGFAISMAEPDLRIYGQQVELFTSGYMTEMMLVYAVSAGIAVTLAFGLWRIVRSLALKHVFFLFYAMIGLLCLLVPREFIALSFDASGTTTGAMTVPFFLALAAGVSSIKSSDAVAAEEDSFGLVGIASAGAILGVLLMAFGTAQQPFAANVTVPDQAALEPFWQSLGHLVPHMLLEVFLSILPVTLLFYLAHFFIEKVRGAEFFRINAGVVYTYLGLVIFMTGVNFGFNRAGYELGMEIARLEGSAVLVLVGLVIGLVVILAEPAVFPLVNQIEDITSGYVPRKLVLIALSLAVGSAVALSMLRIVLPGLELWHMLLPGYLIAIGLSYFVPNLFVGMAFDSGGVASGPMAATFVLSFASGAARYFPGADVFLDGFGVVALIAMMPIVALQLLGMVFQWKQKRRNEA
ncbi:MAG: DUF1538 domain-containing protein [Negativicoccus succinicivorans]|nr:DUF1538 domain-containing protein [Negativicoccus succinicivorans]